MRCKKKRLWAGLCWCLILVGASAEARNAPDSFAPLVQKIAPSVVNISSTRVVESQIPENVFPDEQSRKFFEYFFGQQPPRKFTEHSLGSGVIVDSRGYILTNYHVVQSATQIRVKTEDGKEYDAKLVGTDAPSDLAVLRLEGQGQWPAAELGDSDKLQVGDWVIALGSPFGLAETVTSGIVSAKDRSIGEGPYDDFLQTDASINPGNSGGPLVDANGKVVGINSSIFTTSGGFMGIGFAVPINLANKVYRELVATGRVRRGWLGVSVQPLTQELASHFSLPTTAGALVSSMAENSPASQAGLQPGDVILKINGKPVPAPSDLSRNVSETPPGTTVTLSIQRSGKPQDLSVQLGELPAQNQGKPSAPSAQPESPNQSRLGLHTEDITADIAKQLGLANRSGVLVTGVDAGSPAEEAGLQAGDIIQDVNNSKTPKRADYLNAIKNLKPGDNVLFRITRKGSPLFVAIKLPGPG